MTNCFYCGERMLRRGKRGIRAHRGKTTDHLLPRSRGGSRWIDTPEGLKSNIVYCHGKCNVDKGDRTLEEYRAVVAERKGIPVEQFRFPGEQVHGTNT